jgi:hypothetical protein
MHFASISQVLAYAEPLLWAAAFLAFLRVRKHAALASFGVFLGIRMFRALLLLETANVHVAPGAYSQIPHPVYFYVQWAVYLAGCVAFFFALQEIFRNMMAPLPQLSRLGSIIFRWAAIVSLILASSSIVTLASAASVHDHLAAIFSQIAVSFSILALCLLAFLVVSVHALGLSYRNRVSGLCLGFGLLAAMDLLANGLRDFGQGPTIIASIGTVAALAIWIGFLAAPEPEPQAVAAVSSSAMLWNDLAQELGPSGPQPAAQQSGFLQNVESVVDRVLAKNSVTS